MRWEQRKSDVELTCGVCSNHGPPFPPPNKIPAGVHWVRIWTEGTREDPMCWDCFDELTDD